MDNNAECAEAVAGQCVYPISRARERAERPVLTRARSQAAARWRQRPAVTDWTTRLPRVDAVRWRSLENRVLEVQSRTEDGSHLLCIALRRMDIRLWVSGRSIKEGTVTPGTLHLTKPGVQAECVFKGPYDALHRHIANELIAECNHREVPADAAVSHDPVIERLGMILVESDRLGGTF
jgi:hypothetical protein